MMKTKLATLVLLITALAACSAPMAAEPTDIPQTQPAAVTPTPTTVPLAVEPTPTTGDVQEVEAQPEVQGEVVTFKIIPGESQVAYEVGETFLNQNNRFNLAVGVTTDVNGEIFANLADPPASQLGTIQVDISKFSSDSSRRDGVIRNQWLESARYPIAVFVPKQVDGLPQDYQPAQPYTFRVTGDLTVREVTREVSFDVSAQLDGDTLSGTAETTILMSDYAVGPISILGVLNTEDEVKLIFTFVARR